MQRLVLIGVAAVVLAGSVAQADEAAPQAAPQPGAPVIEPAAPAVPPGTPSAVPPGTPSGAPPGTLPAAPPGAPPAVEPVAPPGEAAAPAAPPPAAAAVQPPAPAAVQSVAPEDAEAILGQRVTDAEGQEIGRLVDVLVDASGHPQAAVIDFGGFMGVGNRKIAVHWGSLRFNPADPKYKIALDMTPDQIKTAPEFRNPNRAAAVVKPAEPAAPSSP